MLSVNTIPPLDALANAGPKELLVAALAHRLRAPGGQALLCELQRHVAACGLSDRRLTVPPAPRPAPRPRDGELDALADAARAWFTAGARRSHLKSAADRWSIAHGLDVLAERGELAADIAAFRAECAERPDCAPQWVEPHRRLIAMLYRDRPFKEVAQEAAWLRRLGKTTDQMAQAA